MVSVIRDGVWRVMVACAALPCLRPRLPTKWDAFHHVKSFVLLWAGGARTPQTSGVAEISPSPPLFPDPTWSRAWVLRRRRAARVRVASCCSHSHWRERVREHSRSHSLSLALKKRAPQLRARRSAAALPAMVPQPACRTSPSGMDHVWVEP